MSRFAKTVRAGSKLVFAQYQLVAGLWFANFVFALIAAIPVFKWLSHSAGHSLALTRSSMQFDFTFIADLLRNYHGLSALLPQLIVIIILYLILSAFLIAGVLYLLVWRNAGDTERRFIDGAYEYFWRILRLGLCVLVVHIILLVILVLVVNLIGINPMEVESDVAIMQRLYVLVPVYVLIVFLLALVHIYAKVLIVRGNLDSVLLALRQAIRHVRRHLVVVTGIYIMGLLALLVTAWLYFMLKHHIPTGGKGAFAAFLLTQLFAVIRICIKLFVHGTAIVHVGPPEEGPIHRMPCSSF